MSFPRRRESSLFRDFWTPAFAGATPFISFAISSKVSVIQSQSHFHMGSNSNKTTGVADSTASEIKVAVPFSSGL